MHYIRPNAFSGAEADRNIGIPQMLFCENVMPMINGYQSVSFLVPIQGIAQTDFDQAFYLRDVAENSTLFVPGVLGTSCKRYTYNQSTNAWATSPKVVPAGAKITVANLKGRTFVKADAMTEFWEWTAGGWLVTAFPALTPANIKGIVAANSYLICYDGNTIYWSSITDPTDYIPSLVTGAGSERVLANKGAIVVCYPVEDGFVIHTTKNAVLAKYSGNSRFPWNFKEIKNSQGLANLEHATPQGDGINQYVWTANGLMSYNPTRADQIFPNLSEFLGCRQIELYNYTTKQIEAFNLTDAPFVKVAFIGARWLCISYGQTATLQACLIYDSALKRWGKIRIDHIDVFEFNGNPGVPGSVTALTWAQIPGTWAQQNLTWGNYGSIISGGAASLTVPYRTLGFLTNSGQVNIVSFDWGDVSDNAVMHVGRIQFLRNNLWTILETEAEIMSNELQTKMAIETSFDGVNVASSVYPYKATNTTKAQKWNSHITGLNHRLRFEGNFNLCSILVRGKNAGSR